MRLLNVHSLEIIEFFEDDIPKYSILSHTWGSEEGTFQQWTNHRSPTASSKRGFAKIISACKMSQADGIDYIWVDTVCIDKTNAVELEEAINSMWAWYRDAQVCYAYMEDYEYIPTRPSLDRLAASRWFTRGWTLQELLAPDMVKFCDRGWSVFGTKSSLKRQISHITGIGEEVMASNSEIKRSSVAQRMSWIAKRKTTRREDIAYCMIGIFDLTMPLIYGEGDRAFIRLQQEVIRNTNDRTVFCWTWPDTIPPPTWMPCLAPHPSAFRDSGQYVRDRKAKLDDEFVYSETSSGGIQTQLRVATCTSGAHFAVLDVTRADDPSGHLVGLPLVRSTSRPSWARWEPSWRAAYPASPIRLPSTWGWARHDLTLARPGLEPFDCDLGKVPSSQGGWPQKKVSPFAALILESVDPKQEQLARLVRTTQPCSPLVFLKPTRSPRVWHHSTEIHTRNGDYLIHLAAWLRPSGKVSWRAGLDALEPHAPVSLIEKQVATWGSKVEFRVLGQGCDGVACLEFSEDGMDLAQDNLGSLEGLVVRPASFNVYLPRSRALFG